MKRLLALLPTLALLTGCPSFTNLGTARTLPKGKGQFFVAPGYIGLQSFQKTSGTNTYESFGLPSIEFGGRYGVTDRFELGGKVWLVGAELDSKIGLIKSERLDSGLNLALAPAASFYSFRASGGTNASYAWVHLPLLIGLGMPGGGELTLGPRVSDMILSSAGQSVQVIWLGGSLGYAIRIGEGMRILPEVTFSYPAGYISGSKSSSDLSPNGGIVQAQLGLLFGGE